MEAEEHSCQFKNRYSIDEISPYTLHQNMAKASKVSQLPLILFKTIAVLLFYPIFFIFICPIYLCRLLVVIVSKVLRPDLVQILGVRDTFYGIDNITTEPKSSVVSTMIFQGDFKPENALRSMERILAKKLDKNTLKYPELHRYLVKWMGFFFWKEDQNFDLRAHIHYYRPTSITYEENGNEEDPKGVTVDVKYVQEVEKQLINEPYAEGKSAWELIILPNYKPEFSHTTPPAGTCTAVFLKLHHSFIDGFSLTRLINNEICNGEPGDLPQPNFPKQNCLLPIFMFFKTPYDMLSELLLKPDQNSWYLTGDRIRNEIKSAISEQISSQRIKEVGQSFGVSFTSVVVAALSGGIRRYMIQRNELKESSTFSCLCPFPVPGHPDTLGNYL
jgi:hypothetical protein